jgi:hypothetical protein
LRRGRAALNGRIEQNAHGMIGCGPDIPDASRSRCGPLGIYRPAGPGRLRLNFDQSGACRR